MYLLSMVYWFVHNQKVIPQQILKLRGFNSTAINSYWEDECRMFLKSNYDLPRPNQCWNDSSSI